MLRPQVPSRYLARRLPNLANLEVLTFPPQRDKHKLLIYYDALTPGEAAAAVEFHERLAARLRRFQRVELLLVNNQERRRAAALAREPPFSRHCCLYDAGRFTAELTERRLLRAYPYCFLFGPRGEFLYEGHCAARELLELSLE